MSELKYKRLVIKLNQPVSYDYCFCYIDIDSVNTSPDLDLSKVYITIKGDSYKWRLSDIIGTKINACGLSIDFEDSERGKTLGLILGEEFYRTELSRVLKPKFFNKTVGPNVTQLYDVDFYVFSITIQNNTDIDIYLGSSTLQNIRIPPNGGYFSLNVYPNKINLKDLYIYASTSRIINVVVFY